MSKVIGDHSIENYAELGVRGREIKVLHPNRRPSATSKIDVTEGPQGLFMRRGESDTGSAHAHQLQDRNGRSRERFEDSVSGRSVSPGSSSTAAEHPRPPQTANSGVGIQFVNLPTPNKDNGERDPSPHIAFARSQQPERALRVPGPLAFDKGIVTLGGPIRPYRC